MKVGDRVKYIGRGSSVLDGGPGEVIEAYADADIVRVRVLVPCVCANNAIRKGEVYVFTRPKLEVVP